MIIAFYGVPGGSTATTSNLISIALMSHFQYGYSVLMASLSGGSASLEMAFEEREQEVKVMEEAGYFFHQGMDLILQEASIGELNCEILKRATKELLSEEIRLLPSAKGSCEERVWQVLEEHGGKLLDCMEESADLVFLDCGKGKYSFMREIKKRAGVLVVNLTQSQRILNQFFQTRQTYLEKTVYLTGHYEDLYPCNRSYMLKNYRIAPENLVEISYHPGLQDVQERGRYLKFFMKNMPVPAYEKNRQFLYEVQLATDRILRKGEILG